MKATFYSNVPEKRHSVTVSQQAQRQDPDTEPTRLNSTNINFVIYTCAFPTVA